ncbi:NUDIX hydrolase [archaeon]|nr:NUDIX hydrolase [archaeon]NCP79447.1 NUDIX hydrolase [archaeon]NCP97390.1 NUDIX hydrolase [archaeon]NCQ07214.1 NUDIX hydrolase [archaeon]NCQ51010.1 NUDIX hydrolase [archaeon]
MATNKAVKAIIFNKDNQMLILKRTPLYKRKGKINVLKKYAHLDKKNIYDLPGGRLEINETIKTGLKREVFEETGLKIKILKKVSSWEFISLDNKKVEVTNFLCEIKKNTSNKIILSQEHDNYKWVDLKNIKRYSFKDKSFFDSLKFLSK